MVRASHRPGATLAALVSLGLSLGLLLVATPPARAQPAAGDAEAVDRARALFQEGVGLAAAQRWEEAAARFEAALEQHRAPAIEYNLASAYFELGRLGPAGDRVASVLSSPEAPTELRDHALNLDRQIGGASGTLRVRIEPAGNEGAVLRVDGHAVPDSRTGAPRHESPGTRRVELVRADGSVETREVEIAAGQITAVTFEARLFGGDGGAEGSAGEGGDSDSSLLGDWRLWAGAGAAVVLTVIIVALVASGGEDEVDGDYQPPVLRF